MRTFALFLVLSGVVVLWGCDDEDSSTADGGDAGSRSDSQTLNDSAILVPDAASDTANLDGGNGDAGGDASTMAIEVTWTNVYAMVIMPSCVGGSCHGGNAGGLNMNTKATAYTNLVNADSNNSGACANMKRVIPNGGGILLPKLEQVANAYCEGTMPLGGSKLAQSQIDLVKGWIEAGALNN